MANDNEIFCQVCGESLILNEFTKIFEGIDPDLPTICEPEKGIEVNKTHVPSKDGLVERKVEPNIVTNMLNVLGQFQQSILASPQVTVQRVATQQLENIEPVDLGDQIELPLM